MWKQIWLYSIDGSTDNAICSLGKNYVDVTFLHVKNVLILYHCIRYKAKFHSLVCVCTRYHLLFKFAVEHHGWSREKERILTNKFYNQILHLAVLVIPVNRHLLHCKHIVLLVILSDPDGIITVTACFIWDWLL